MSLGVEQIAVIIITIFSTIYILRKISKKNQTINFPSPSQPEKKTQGPLAINSDSKIQALIGEGNLIEAIKLIQTTQRIGLKEAKELAEQIEAKMKS